MTPKSVIIKWVELFNLGNADELAELYHDDAINHQVANEPVNGKIQKASGAVVFFIFWTAK